MPHVKPEKKTVEKAIRAVSTAYRLHLAFSVPPVKHMESLMHAMVCLKFCKVSYGLTAVI